MTCLLYYKCDSYYFLVQILQSNNLKLTKFILINSSESDSSPVEYDGHEIILYYMFMSPPCRAVMITAKILGINLKLVECDVFKGDNKTPEFTKVSYLYKYFSRIPITLIAEPIFIIKQLSRISIPYWSLHYY